MGSIVPTVKIAQVAPLDETYPARLHGGVKSAVAAPHDRFAREAADQPERHGSCR